MDKAHGQMLIAYLLHPKTSVLQPSPHVPLGHLLLALPSVKFHSTFSTPPLYFSSVWFTKAKFKGVKLLFTFYLLHARCR
jgi:hypothetical protein